MRILNCYIMKYSHNGAYLIVGFNKAKGQNNSLAILDGNTLEIIKIIGNNFS